VGAKSWYGLDTALEVLREYKTWAVVGCSAKRDRPSYGVASFLLESGYKVLCVNPNETECIKGTPCYPDLATAAEHEEIEVVDIFRRSEAAGAHVDEAIAIGARAVWMQLGVIDEEAAARAEAAGLHVVMDRCPRIDLPRLRVS
jgi:predicted CoA-binding protein